MAIKLVSALSTAQYIQFQNSSGTSTGKIEANGDDLIITNSVGNVLFGDLDSNVYIGDGVNNVDIIFEQSGAIRSENGSNATITLGGSGTTLNVYNPNIANGASLTSTLSIGTGGVIDFLPDTGAIINLDGQTILKRNTFNGGITLGHDDAVIIAGGDTYNTLESNISLGNETVYLGAEGGVTIYAFPNNDTAWSNRQQFSFNNDGKMYFGTAADTNLYRSGGNTLKTDDDFVVGGTLTAQNEVHWDLSAGEYAGDPRAVAMGYSGGNYGQLGYGLDFTTTSGVHTYAINDIATRIDLYDGIQVYTSTNGGTIGSSITWTELLDVRSSVFQYKGNNILYGSINNNDWSGADLSVANGGTGASTASAARTNLGLGTAATSAATDFVAVSGDTMTGNLTMSTNNINFNTSDTNPNFIGDRSTTRLNDRSWSTEGGWAYSTFDDGSGDEPSATSHNANGLLNFNTHSGNYNFQIAMVTSQSEMYLRNQNGGGFNAWRKVITDADSVSDLGTINNSNWSGTDLAITNGGTGASTASAARTNLGLGTAATSAATDFVAVSGDTMTGTLTVPRIHLTNSTNNDVGNRITVYESGATSYGMMLWNDNGTSGDWATMIYGPNQSNRKISFGKANANFPGTKDSVDELAYVDLDNGNFVATGTLTASGYNDSNWNTAYSWGNHASAGYLTAHPNITAASSVNNSGRSYIQDITVDSNGHVTGITSATETVVNTDTVTSVGLSGSEASGTITLTDAGATTITQSGNTIEIRSTDTTYTVGDGGLTQKNFTSTLKTKLDGIEASADVTDATNVSAAGALMRSGGTMTGKIITNSSNGNGIQIGTGGTNITSVTPSSQDVVFQNLGQLRFGGASWDWNAWAGIKFDDTNEILYIGGPAASQFTSNASPPTIDVNFVGVDEVQLGGNALATQEYVNTAVSNVVASAPAALDTLNELAAALGDDANFSTTMSTALGNRLRVDTASQGLTSTQKSNARTNLGLGSAATTASSAYATAAQGTTADAALPKAGGTITGQVIFPSAATTKPVLPNGFISRNDTSDTSGRHDIWGISERYYPSNSTTADAWGIQWSGTPNDVVFVGGGEDKVTISLDEGNITTIGTITASGGNSGNWNTAYADRNKWDGGSTGLNAATGRTSLGLGTLATLNTVDAATITNNSVGAAELNVSGNGSSGQVLTSDGDGTFSWTAKTTNTDTVTSVGVSGSEVTGTVTLTAGNNVTLTQTGNTIEIRSNDTTYSNATTSTAGLMSTTDKSKLDGIESGATADQTASEILTKLLTVDGAGSGLDADKLDGISSGSFLRSDTNDVLYNNLVIDQVGGNGGIVYEYSGGVYVPKPNGANYATTTSSFTGAIEIALPTDSWNQSDMISFWVDIYDYNGGSEGESVSLYVYGYPYGTGSWTNCGAVILTDRTDRDYTVRFGHNGSSRHLVYIGETTSTWNYLQISIRDFQAGYSGQNTGRWNNGWAITPNIGSFSNVQRTSSNNYPVTKQLKTARNIALSGDVTGSANFDGSSNITISATVADNSHNHSASNITSGTLPIARGGTNATTSAAARTNLGLGTLATLNTVDAATITNNSVGAAELNVSGNGTSGQVLTSDGDGTFSWTAKTTNTDTITTVGLTGSETSGTITLSGAGATTITQSGGAIEIRSTNTEYTVGDGGLTQNNFTDALKTKLDGIAASANNYSHPTHPGDDFSVDTGALTGYNVVSDIDINVTTDTLGHVTDANGSVSTRQLANLRIPDTRAGEIVPNDYLDNALSLDFTDEFGSLGAWYSGITLKGWSDGYAAWQLIANSANNTTDQNLYFRSGTGTSWGTMHTVYHSGNLTVGDGGLTQKNFTTTLKNKLDAIEASADVTDTANVVAALTAGTNITIAANGTISSQDTTYTVGDGGLTQVNFTTARSTKLDGIAEGANAYVHPTGAGNKHIPSGGAAGQFLKYSSSGTAVWATPDYTTNTDTVTSVGVSGSETTGTVTIAASGAASVSQSGSTITIDATNTTYTVGDGGLTQKNFTTALKTKLDGIAAGATVYGGWNLLDGSSVVSRVDSLENVKFTGANISGTGSSSDPFIVTTPNTTYTAGGDYGIGFSGTEIRLKADRRRNISTADIYTGNTHDYTFYDADIGIRWYTAGAEEMRLEDDGDLHVDGDVIAFSTTVSDARLKDDVETIENATDKVKQLRGVEYTWNKGSRKGQREIGVIAQEVEAVVPEVVHDKKLPLVDDETYKTVDYEKLVALLIESNKELAARVETLEAKLDGLTK